MTADFLTDEEMDYFAQSSDEFDLNSNSNANIDSNDYVPGKEYILLCFSSLYKFEKTSKGGL